MTGTTGATQGGVITQLVSRGVADFQLNGDAEVTYWRMQHSSHTNFALEPIAQAFDNNVAFGGSTATITFTRTGDLMHRQYIVMDLPGLFPKVSSGTTSSYAYVLDSTAASGGGNYMPTPELEAGLRNPMGGFYAHWVNAIGFAALKSVQLIVGGHVIDTVTSDYLYMFEELTGKPGKRLQDMVGKFETREQLVAYSRRPQRLHVPLPFWYTQVAGNALSLVSLAFHGVKLAVDFAELQKLIIVSNKDIVVDKAKSDGSDSGKELTESDFSAHVLTEYVYLDVVERNKFSEGLFDQLIHQVQTHKQSHTQGSSVQLNLMFNHPVLELWFACRLKANETANKWFDYSRVGPAKGSGKYSGSGTSFPTKTVMQPQTEGVFDVIAEHESTATDTTPNLIADDGMYNLGDVVTVNADPITEVSLKVNSLARFAPQDARYFREVQPAQHHASIPKGFIYVYSFALFPEDPNPSGSLNWSRLDSVILELTLHDDIVGHEVNVMVFARSWQIFSYREGVGGAAFLS